MIEITKYQAEDKTIFDTKDECLNYEKLIHNLMDCTKSPTFIQAFNIFLNCLENYTLMHRPTAYCVLGAIKSCRDIYNVSKVNEKKFIDSVMCLEYNVNLIYEKERYLHLVTKQFRDFVEEAFND